MKNNILLTIMGLFLFNSFAQKPNVSITEKIVEPTQITANTISGKISSSTSVGIIYHVTEKVNMKFGGYTITYDVMDPSLINTYDLGPNNTRVVTTSNVKVKKITDIPQKTTIDTLKPIIDTSNLVDTVNNLNEMEYSKKTNDSAYIDIIKIYEKVADKGYKSINIFKKLGNAYYFKADLDKAAKWYGELFAMTSDVDPEYYYRYAYCLKSIGQTNKAEQMLEAFNQKSGNNKNKITAK